MHEREKESFKGVEIIEKSAFYCTRFRFAMMIGINHLKNIKLKKNMIISFILGISKTII